MTDEKKSSFDVQRLIDDLGGASQVAEITGKNRTTPYRWIKQGFINTKLLEVIKEQNPSIDINSYFS